MKAVSPVLRADGTVWLNVADSYSMRTRGGQYAPGGGYRAEALPVRPSTTAVTPAKSPETGTKCTILANLPSDTPH
jgi:hypothetical protein